MDFDLRHLRAFVKVSEERHFGRAAEQLHVSQQTISKRVLRLEKDLGIVLLVRTTRTVELTESGHRLLPLARKMLASADQIGMSLKDSQDAALGVDIMEEHLAPTAVVRSAIAAHPHLQVQISARRSLRRSFSAIQNGEVDMAFGRIYDGGVSIPEGFIWEIVRMEPLVVVVPSEHELAHRTSVSPATLSRWGIWTPATAAATEWTNYVTDFGQAFGIPTSLVNVHGTDVGQILHLAKPPENSVFVSGMDVVHPETSRFQIVCLTNPTPTYPWALVWKKGAKTPQMERFLEAVRSLRQERNWCAAGVATWVPQADRAMGVAADSLGA